MRIIGIAGLMGSGKNTVADIMIREELADYQCSFASNVKRYARELFNVDYHDRTPEVRKILQQLGGKMREIDENIWINLLMNQLKWLYPRHGERILITDVRYKNEADWILKSGGEIIFIDTIGHIRQKRIEFRDDILISYNDWIEWHNHSSERELQLIKIMSHAIDGSKGNKVDDLTYFNVRLFNNDESLIYHELHDNFTEWYKNDKT